MFASSMQFRRGAYGSDYMYESHNSNGGNNNNSSSNGGGNGYYYSQSSRRGGNNNRSGGQNGRKKSMDEDNSSHVARDGSAREVTSSSSASSSSSDTGSARPAPFAGSVAAKKMPCCNLDRFLEFTTPTVPLLYLPKTTMKLWKVSEVESVPFFNLGDLWESYNEWSAYGAGVPIALNESDTAIQYYVPYLSAIQLYSHPTLPATRRLGEDSDTSDFDYRDSSSEGSSSDETDREGIIQWRNSKAFDGNLQLDRLSIREQSKVMQEGSSSDEGEGNNKACFEYFEKAPPYCREPLADKIADLAKCFPRLKTLRSFDLSPSSWLSVAWYPIYRIPTGTTLRDLGACFLTFHGLSTPLKDERVPLNVGGKPISGYKIITLGGCHRMALPAFGLAAYKFTGSVWSATGNCGRMQADSLQKSADDWLKVHRVHHPDYEFFLQHSTRDHRG